MVRLTRRHPQGSGDPPPPGPVDSRPRAPVGHGRWRPASTAGIDTSQPPGAQLALLPPSAGGGAEVNIFEQAMRWARAGHQVTVFTADPGRQHAPTRDEWFNGVRVVRRGGQLTVYIHAALYMTLHPRSFDRVVDIENGIPFFAPLFTRHPVVLLVHHVHGKQWQVEFPGITGKVGRFLETRAMPLVYRRRPVIAVSPTTREALEEIGFYPAGIAIVFNGTHIPALRPGQNRSRTMSPMLAASAIQAPRRVVDAAASFAPNVRPSRWTSPAMATRVRRFRPASTSCIFRTVSTSSGSSMRDQGGHSWPRRRSSPRRRAGRVGPVGHRSERLWVPGRGVRCAGLKVAIRDGETGLLARDPQEFCRDIGLLLRRSRAPRCVLRAARAWAETFDWDVSAARRWALIAGGKDALAAAVAPRLSASPASARSHPGAASDDTGRDAGSSPGGPHGLVAA